MAASSIVPLSVSAKTREELSIKLAKVNEAFGGKMQWISFYYDPTKREHVCWYVPPRGHGIWG